MFSNNANIYSAIDKLKVSAYSISLLYAASLVLLLVIPARSAGDSNSKSNSSRTNLMKFGIERIMF